MIFSIILAILILCVVTNSTNLITYTTIINYYINHTTINNCSQSHEVIFAERFLIILVRLFIPFSTMLCLNIKVILRLRDSKKRTGLNTSMTERNQATTDRDSRFAITTILIDLIFLVFNLPNILTIGYYFLNEYVVTNFIIDLISTYSVLLSLSYSAALVLIFLIFNRIFRKEFIAVFRLGKLARILPFRGLQFKFFFSSNNSIDNHNQH